MAPTKHCTLTAEQWQISLALHHDLVSIHNAITYADQIARTAMDATLAADYRAVATYLADVVASTKGKEEHPVPHPSQTLSCFV
jgi:hypothetical protein